MTLPHLSTSTPASSISRAEFERNDTVNSGELETPSFDDILRNSPAAKLIGLAEDEESLPDESSEDVPTPADSEDSDSPDASEDAEDEADDSDQEDSTEEDSDEDDTSTQDAELPKEEDIDWEYKVPVTVDGKTEYLTLEEIRKGFATDRHLSQKGRELGELKKQIEQERTEKLAELVNLGTVLNEELTSYETALATEYHSIKEKMDQARNEGDTYTARELRDELESVQEKYWQAKTKREQQLSQVAVKIQEQQAVEQQKWLSEYESQITTLIPDYSEKVAKSVREFAISEGIPPELLDNVYSAKVVKFIDDYRRLKTAKSAGVAKRKAAPVAKKSVPTKKGTPSAVKEKAQADVVRSRVLSGEADNAEQMAFLKSLSSVGKKLGT
jgi:hypothetical protein